MQIVYYLSGLTCTDENVVQKSGAQRKAAELGLALIAPDTSPRGLDTPGGHGLSMTMSLPLVLICHKSPHCQQQCCK